MASITRLLLAPYLKRIESDGRADYAKVLERRAMLILPPTFGPLVVVSVVYFFIIL